MYPFEHSTEEIKQQIEIVTHHLIEYFKNFEEHLLDRSQEGLEKALQIANKKSNPPMEKQDFQEIIQQMFEQIPQALNTVSGGYLAYIPGGGLFESAIADFITTALNRYVGINFAAPLLSHMEKEALQWMIQWVGFTEKSSGVFTTGGSIANLTALITARTIKLGENIAKGIIYTSELTHHSVKKAAMAAGILDKQLRFVSVNNQGQMDIKELDKQIQIDSQQGFIPFLVIGNAGTTDCGSVDDLSEIAQVAQQNNLWFHVDGAYGGFFVLTERGKKVLRGIEQADSITLDPHKGLFLPYGTGAVLVRNSQNLTKTFRCSAQYITDTIENESLWDFSEMSLELSREARGVKVWLPIKAFGVKEFIKNLDEKLTLTEELYRQLKDFQNCEIYGTPQLTVIAFRFQFSEGNLTEENEKNKAILRAVNRKNRIHISGTTINGKYYLRSCILSYRTHKKQIDWLLEDLQFALEGSDSL
ncbi:MAG: aminotransferase class V-fold PLP-dependent enzyme [Spirochaetes bacterium]|nr:aminotransferase class V-fold PLP-dependent enzyme [Spirochaetota bacterium]